METRRDLARIVFSVLFIGTLIGLSLWILRPFLPAMLWATTIVIATWSVMLQVQARLWNRRWLAVTVMSGGLLLLFVLPFTMAVGAIVNNAASIAERARTLMTVEVPALPEWVVKLPFIGERIAVAWRDLTAGGGAGLVTGVRPYLGSIVRWFAGSVGSLGGLFVQFLLTVAVTAVFYASGEGMAARVRRFALRLAGSQGEGAVHLAAQAIRAVALGVVLTAMIQAVVAGLGLLIAGVPFAAILTAVMFMLALAQLGPLPVMVPAVAWLYWSGSSGWGTFLLVWAIVFAPLDNILRPILIRRTAKLSFVLVFAGVVGGLIAFGLVGIFIGPVVLAVSSTLINAWIDAGLESASTSPPPAGAA